MRSKGVAALLAFFLGSIGGHKFYLGETTKGILYFIFSWTFIPALIAFFEFIGLLLMSERDFNRKYNSEGQAGGRDQQQIGQNVTVNIEDDGGAGSTSTGEELERLQNLREKGTLSDEEFRREKQKVLSE